MYPLDLLTLPGTFLRRTRLWYAKGRTWRQRRSAQERDDCGPSTARSYRFEKR